MDLVRREDVIEAITDAMAKLDSDDAIVILSLAMAVDIVKGVKPFEEA